MAKWKFTEEQILAVVKQWLFEAELINGRCRANYASRLRPRPERAARLSGATAVASGR